MWYSCFIKGGGDGNDVAEVLWFTQFWGFFLLIVVGQRRKVAKFFNLSDLALQTLLLVMFSITLRSFLGAGILSPRTHL